MRAVPIHSIGIRHSLFMGGDREVVMFTGMLAIILVVLGQKFITILAGAALWFFVLTVARKVAIHDPFLRHVYMRSQKYEKFYPARSTPFYHDKKRDFSKSWYKKS